MKQSILSFCFTFGVVAVFAQSESIQIRNAQSLVPVSAEFRVGSLSGELKYTDDDGKIPSGMVKRGDSIYVFANGFEKFAGVYDGKPIFLAEKAVKISQTEGIHSEYLQPTVVISEIGRAHV